MIAPGITGGAVISSRRRPATKVRVFQVPRSTRPIKRSPRRQRRFADQAAWQHHLERLGITALHVTPDPVCIATEGALWGAVMVHGFLQQTAILSDDAGQFAIARHALCWVHAERLVHQLDAFSEHDRAAQQRLRGLIWRFYAGLQAYRAAPTLHRRTLLRARFDRIIAAPSSPLSIACCSGGTPTNPNCCWSSTARKSPSTRTVRKTISASGRPTPRQRWHQKQLRP